MPAKKKATDTTQTPIAPVDAKAKGQIIEVNHEDEDTRVVTTSSTKAVKGKATKAADIAAKAKATLAPTKSELQAAKAPKAPKEKLPKPVTITRTELAIEIVKAVGQYMTITGQESEAILSEIINTMIDSLKEGNKIEIRGFGSFRLRVRRSRISRNPRTGARVDVPSKTVVYFKLGKELKEILLTPRETNSNT